MSTTETDAVIAAEVETPWSPDEFRAAHQSFAGHWSRRDKVDDYKAWFSVMQRAHQLHPCVEMMVADHRPKDVDQLALEWAHISTQDESRIAYTRNDVDGVIERRLVTSIGKYLARHWPHVSDHIRRDVQAHYTPDTRKIVSTVPEMILAVEDGPRSCMASVHGTIPFKAHHKDMMGQWFSDPTTYMAPPWELHPYACYRPDLGWSMAMRIATLDDAVKTKRIDGRALLWKDPADTTSKSYFVRTYARNKNDPINGWSETDFPLQAWLERNGHVKLDSWPAGVRLHSPKRNESSTHIRAPYIDGGRRLLTAVADLPDIYEIGVENDSRKVGSFWCENTSGYAAPIGAPVAGRRGQDLEDFAGENDYDVDECMYCDDCGEAMHQDDSTPVGRDGESQVCGGCIDNYQWVRGSSHGGNYRAYYINSDYSAYIDNADYSVDTDNLPDGVCCTESGSYALEDDCVYIEDCGWFFADDEGVVCRMDGEYDLREYCVKVEDCPGEWVDKEAAFESDDCLWYSTAEARDEAQADAETEETETETEAT